MDPEKGSGKCTNSKCKCPSCICGSGCTCNVSSEWVCNPCRKYMKKYSEYEEPKKKGKKKKAKQQSSTPKTNQYQHSNLCLLSTSNSSLRNKCLRIIFFHPFIDSLKEIKFICMAFIKLDQYIDFPSIIEKKSLSSILG